MPYAHVTRSHRRNLRQELEEGRRKLEESCRRLEEILRRREEEIRRWDEEMAKLLEEEARRHEEQRKAEQQHRTQQHRAQQEFLARRSAMAAAWVRYEQQWQMLQSVSSGLTFRSIPWPVVTTVTLPESLGSHLISHFILSPEHSQTESRKRRIHTALLRWHSDHFDAKVLHKVVERDRPAVKEGVGRVVRCLNELLASEGI